MTSETADRNGSSPAIDADAIARELREAIAARAQRLGIDPRTVGSPTPRAVTARSSAGDLLRLDVSTYCSADLDR
jgi:hypothetical protein